jgi:DNA polymerase III epsilon subunit-like protein
MMNTAVFDIETNAIKEWKTLGGLEVVHCIVIMDNEGTHRYRNNSEMDTIPEALERLAKADCLVAHNGIGFDLPALKKLYGFTHDRVIDTMVLARLNHPDRKKEDWTEAKLPTFLRGSHSLKSWGMRLGVHKDDHGATESWERWSEAMEDYCVQDVVVNEALFTYLMQGRTPTDQDLVLEMDFATAIRQQEWNGFPFDMDAAEQLLQKLIVRRATLEEDLQQLFPPKVIATKRPWWITDDMKQWETKKEALAAGYKAAEIEKGPMRTKSVPFNPSSRDQIAERLMADGWDPKYYEGKRPAINELVLREINSKKSLALLEYLLVAKRLGQLSEGRQGWMKMVNNGRIHGSVNTGGTVSGRCSHQAPNIAQCPSVSAEYGYECRSLFIAPPGRVLVGCDASGLELRMLASYLHKIDDGRYTNEILSGDIHTANQEAAGLPDRNSAKAFVYCLIYGGSDSKLGEVIGGNATDGKRLKSEFFRKMPAIKRLRDAVQDKVKGFGFLRGLDGRKLPCRSPHSSLNLLLQSAGAICMKQALVHFVEDMEGKEYLMHANVHDEVQFSCDPRRAHEYGQRFVNAIKKAGETFNLLCPLDGEYKIGTNWAETH